MTTPSQGTPSQGLQSQGTPSQGLWRSLVAHPRHGAMPILLLGLTVLTGTIDAASILSLGRVFVANMTGKVVFVGFALAGAPGFSLAASLFAIGGFLVGAAGGGALSARRPDARQRLLRDCVIAELLLVVAMLLGAVLGALTVLHIGTVAGLGLSAVVLAVVTVGAMVTAPRA